MNFSELVSNFGRIISDLGDTISERVFEGNSVSSKNIDDSSIRLAILAILSIEPASGSQILKTLQLTSAGSWTPTEAKIFSLLQQLVDEGLLKFEIKDELRTYRITKLGKEYLVNNANKNEDFDTESANFGSSKTSFDLPKELGEKGSLLKSGARFGQAISAVATSDSAKAVAEAKAIVDSATAQLYSLLAKTE